MAELVYAPVLGTGSRKGLEVRVLFWAQIRYASRQGGILIKREFESDLINAVVAELVYAPVLGTGSRKGLGVRVSPAAPRKIHFAHNGAWHEFLILGNENGRNIHKRQ